MAGDTYVYKKCDEFLDIFSKSMEDSEVKKIAIYSHAYPDPDAIASAYALQWLITKKFNKDAIFLYEGEISHQQNKTMVNLLEIPMVKISANGTDDFDIKITVDTTSKNSICSNPDFTIDHHRVDGVEATKAVWVETIGSCSTLIYELIKQLDLHFEDEKDYRVATALLLGLRTDTNNLVSENMSQKDHQASAELHEYVDHKKLKSILNYNVPVYFFELEKEMYAKENYSRIVQSCFMGTVGIISASKRDAISMLSEKMARHENVDTAIVFAVVYDSAQQYCLDVSARTKNDSVNIGEFIHDIFGCGGGKLGAGGVRIPLEGMFSYINLSDDLKIALFEIHREIVFHRVTKYVSKS